MVWENRVQSQVELYQTQKEVFDATLLNTQHYNVKIKDKFEQSREWRIPLPNTLLL